MAEPNTGGGQDQPVNIVLRRGIGDEPDETQYRIGYPKAREPGPSRGLRDAGNQLRNRKKVRIIGDNE